MTMTFRVADARVARERAPGDLIEATLVVRDASAWLEHVRKIGFAALAPPAAAAAAAAGFELLEPGDAAPDHAFVDETGRTRRVSDWRGRAVAITFIYTRCPIPTFCPAMDRHFAAAQREIRGDAALRHRVKLLSISFDPAYDTPAVLRAHAKKAGAAPETWSFLTGDRDEVDRFAARFGVSVVRDPQNAVSITHNLRTAVIDDAGRLTQIFTGNEWTPAQLLAAIRDAAKRRE
jgi:protein SCO1/2